MENAGDDIVREGVRLGVDGRIGESRGKRSAKKIVRSECDLARGENEDYCGAVRGDRNGYLVSVKAKKLAERGRSV